MGNLFARPGGWIIGIIVAVIGFVAVNTVANQTVGVRLDLTEDRLYTLSEGSRNILSELDKPITMTLYYSRELGNRIPQFATYAAHVQDMLREFVSESGGTISLEIVNPRPFSEEEDRAVELGLQAVPLDETGEVVYFGLFASVTGEEEGGAIPFFQGDRETFLEYDLTKLVWQVANPEQPVIGVISSKPVFGNPMAAMRGDMPDPWYALVQAQDFFDLRYVTSAESLLNTDPDILLIIHPGEMDDPFLYAIDQFLLRGGKAMIFVDPWNESFVSLSSRAGGITGGMAASSDLPQLFERWGIGLEPEAVVGDRSMARMVNAGRDGEVVAAPYPAWIEIGPEAMNREDAIMAPIREMMIPSPGAITVEPDAPVAVTPLITTTEEAMLIDPEELRAPDPFRLLERYEPGGTPRILAARITGAVDSAFPDGPPQPAAEEDGEGENGEGSENAAAAEPLPFKPHLGASESPMSVIVVADADMLEDQYWTRLQNFFGQRVAVPTLDNGTFMVNALENLNGSTDLLSLRARRTARRPFEVIEALRLDAENRFRAEEQRLSRKLEEVQQEFAELQSGGEVSDEAMETITEELVETRRNLREVNLKLREDIQELEQTLRFLNIGLVPAIVIVLAIGIGLYRSRRNRAA